MSERISKWDSEKRLEKKRVVAGLLAERFPDCRNKSIVMMPSVTCLDIEAMKNKSKIDSRTRMYGFEHLMSSCFAPRMVNKYRHVLSDDPRCVERRMKADFMQSLRNRLNEIFGADSFYKDACERFTFGDILESSLNRDFATVASRGGFRLVYADLCGHFSEKVATWLCWSTTVNSLSEDGVLAFTVMLNRWSENAREFVSCTEPLSHPCEMAFLGEYSRDFGAEYYFGLMNGIARHIEAKSLERHLAGETNGHLVATMMAHYCEADRRSQMATIVCKKMR